MRPTLAVLAASATLALLALASAPSAHSARGRAAIRSGGAPVAIRVNRAHCATGRTVMRAYLRRRHNCTTSACARHVRGWTCGSATAAAFPRLASCRRQRATVRAYSTAD